MRVQCILCDTIEKIDSGSLLAKQLRKRRVMTHMCQPCKERIEQRTEARKATGNFRLYREQKKEFHLS